VRSPPLTTPWAASGRSGDFAGLVGATSYEWDRTDGGAIVERSAIDGKLGRSRPIAGLHINGDPSYWEGIAGGFVAHWGSPTVISEAPDGALSVAWKAPGDDWFSAHVVVGGSLLAAGARSGSAIVRLALADGHEEWRTPLVAWSQSMELEADERRVYTNYTEYVPTAPTPTIAIPLRVQAFDLDSGKLAWSVDFKKRPNSAAARRDTVVVAVGNELHFIDGPTGVTRRRVQIGGPNTNVYPTLHIADDRLYAGLDTGILAFDLASGALRWRAPLELSSTPRLATLPTMILAATPAASVAALDLQTGAPLWEIGLGVSGYRLHATGAAVLVSGGRVAGGFGLPVNLPPERATFHGRVREVKCGTFAEVQVRVGSLSVPVAPDGTFHAEIEARHAVLVEGPGSFALMKYGAPPEEKAARVIRLTGAGDYAVPDLTLSVCDT
jgi:hypothetical protein